MVFLKKCDSYDRDKIYAITEEIFESFGGTARFEGKNVVIKPNLVAKKKPEEAATTHPSLVWACASVLVKAGANVVIAESPGGLYTKEILKSLYRVTGIEAAAAESGATLNFDTSVSKVENPSGLYLKSLDVLTPLTKADYIIDICKMKTHGMMVYTGAVKNMFGAIAGIGKPEYHCKMPDYDSFADTVTDIYLSVKPCLCIMDAVVSMHKDGPTAGEPLNTGAIFASDDGFALDRIAVEMIGAEVSRVPMMRRAIARGLAASDTAEIEVCGDIPRDYRFSSFVVKYNDEAERLHFSDGIVGSVITGILKPRPQFTSKCRSCGECARLCPVKAITVEKGKRARADLKKCIRCYCCQELCPAKAVKIKKTLISKMVTK